MSRGGASCNIHASAVALAGRGLLILGRSGAGKSGLALRLMALGARLVADDRVMLRRAPEGLFASAPAELAGLIEARGVGILRGAFLPETSLAYAVDLDAAPTARMPQRREISFLDVQLELIFGKDVPNLDATLAQLLRCGKLP